MYIKVLLASGSPRRKEMLGWLGWKFEVMPVNIDESVKSDESAEQYVQRMAREKALTAKERSDKEILSSCQYILAADTIVIDGQKIMGKPENEEQAFEILSQLRGKEHRVITATGLIDIQSGTLLEDYCDSPVFMRNYSDEEMVAYIRSGDPMDKAGAYAIQNGEFKPVENFNHCFANVMGLPFCNLFRLLRTRTEGDSQGIAELCKARLDYTCTISTKIYNNMNEKYPVSREI